jgi:general secretion pathway protein I
VLIAFRLPKPGDPRLPARHHRALVQAGASARDEGFTLVELVVALAILSVSLTLILRTLSGGFYYQQQAGALADATLLAQSLMARVGRDLPLKPGIEEGIQQDRLAWKVQIEPYGSASEQREWATAPYAVSVTISLPQGSEKSLVVLHGLKLGPKDASW